MYDNLTKRDDKSDADVDETNDTYLYLLSSNLVTSVYWLHNDDLNCNERENGEIFYFSRIILDHISKGIPCLMIFRVVSHIVYNSV